jgi:hypothetical protein
MPVMRSLAANILFCMGVVLTVGGGSPAQANDAEEAQTIHLTPFHGPDIGRLIGYGNCQWLYPLDEPNEVLLSEPAYGSDNRVYYAARYGDGEDNIYTFVIDESAGTGTGFDTLYADLNNDNRLDPNTEKFPLALSGLTTEREKPVRITLSVSAGGKTIPYAFDFTAFRYKDRNHPVEKIHANCRNSTVMIGEAVFDGKRYKVALADLDSNGLFNDYEQDVFQGDRFFVDLDGNGSFSGGSRSEENFPYAQYTQIAGKWYTVEASPDGGTVRIQPSQPTFGTIKAAAHTRQVGLSSPRQFQSIDFTDGRAEALSGVFQVRGIWLEIVDGHYQRWSTFGRYRQSGPTITIEPDQETTFADVLPLMIQVAVLPTSEPNIVELELRIVDRHGGSFGTLRRNSSRHQPPARLVIKDADGRQVVEAALEYG